MDSALDILPSLSNKIIADNPEVEEQRCRICYEDSKPLITLCECSGSIAFVHQDCILDWITKKMENSEIVEIPKCEICRATYSAKLKIGRKKICPKLLLKKVKELKMCEIFASIFYIFGTILSVIVGSTTVFELFTVLLTSSSTEVAGGSSSYSAGGFILKIMKDIVFSAWFVRCAITHCKARLKLVEESRVQIVQVTLSPKLIVKQ